MSNDTLQSLAEAATILESVPKKLKEFSDRYRILADRYCALAGAYEKVRRELVQSETRVKVLEGAMGIDFPPLSPDASTSIDPLIGLLAEGSLAAAKAGAEKVDKPTWWCCGAPFGKHEQGCKNKKEECHG